MHRRTLMIMLAPMILAAVWAMPAEAVYPTNGGFESNLYAWTTQYGSVSISADAYAGSSACLLQGGASGAGVNSVSFTVWEGRTYQLQSYVKQTAGTGKYKVTIAWINPEGTVLRYDNDWAGTNSPSSYTYHGGGFLAPENAKTAVIMLGVQSGTNVLFDEIKLIPQDNPYAVWLCPDYRYDANNLFVPGASWETAAARAEVFKLHIRELNDSDPERSWILNVGQMVSFLDNHDLDLAIEAAGTMGGDHCSGNTGLLSAQGELALINRVYAYGGSVKYLMLDGPISRIIDGGRLAGDGGAGGNCGYTLQESVNHLVTYIQYIHQYRPQIKIGLGVNYDHWEFQGYRSFFGTQVENYTLGSGYKYNEVLDVLLPAVIAAGDRIEFIHVDNPYRPYYIATQAISGGATLDQKGKVRTLQAYCASRNIDFGAMYNTQDASTDAQFFSDTRNHLASHDTSGIQPLHLTVQSWYDGMPSAYLPDSSPYTFMYLAKVFANDAAQDR